jgi:hypothetical protein
MELSTAQEKSNQNFFTQPKAHQFKLAEMNKMMSMDPLWLIAFFEQCQAANKAASILEKIANDKKQPDKKKMAHLPIARSCESSYWLIATSLTIIEATNVIVTTDNPTIVIKKINPTIILVATAGTIRATSPMKRRRIASAITSRKRATRPCTMTSPLLERGHLVWKKELLLLKISFTLLFWVSLWLMQQEL